MKHYYLYTEITPWNNETFLKPHYQSFYHWISHNNRYNIKQDLKIIWDTLTRGNIQLTNDIPYTYLLEIESNTQDPEKIMEKIRNLSVYTNIKGYFLYPNTTTGSDKDTIVYEAIPDLWVNHIMNKNSLTGTLNLTSNESFVLDPQGANKVNKDVVPLNLETKTKKSGIKINYYEIKDFVLSERSGATNSSHLDTLWIINYNVDKFILNVEDKLSVLTNWFDGSSVSDTWIVKGKPIPGHTLRINGNINTDEEINKSNKVWTKHKKGGLDYIIKKKILLLNSRTFAYNPDPIYDLLRETTANVNNHDFKNLSVFRQHGNEFFFNNRNGLSDGNWDGLEGDMMWNITKYARDGLNRAEQVYKEQDFKYNRYGRVPNATDPWNSSFLVNNFYKLKIIGNVKAVNEANKEQYEGKLLQTFNLKPIKGVNSLRGFKEVQFNVHKPDVSLLLPGEYYLTENSFIYRHEQDENNLPVYSYGYKLEQDLDETDFNIEFKGEVTVVNNKDKVHNLILSNGTNVNLTYGKNIIKYKIKKKLNGFELSLDITNDYKKEKLFYNLPNTGISDLLINQALAQQDTNIYNRQLQTLNYDLQVNKDRANLITSTIGGALGLVSSGALAGVGITNSPFFNSNEYIISKENYNTLTRRLDNFRSHYIKNFNEYVKEIELSGVPYVSSDLYKDLYNSYEKSFDHTSQAYNFVQPRNKTNNPFLSNFISGIGGVVGGVTNLIGNIINYKYDREIKANNFKSGYSNYISNTIKLENDLINLKPNAQIESDWNRTLRDYNLEYSPFIIFVLTPSEKTLQVYNNIKDFLGINTNQPNIYEYILEKDYIYSFSNIQFLDRFDEQEVKNMLALPFKIVDITESINYTRAPISS